MKHRLLLLRIVKALPAKGFKPRLRQIVPHASSGAQKWKVKAGGENGGWWKASVHAEYTDATCWYTEIC